MNINLKLSVVLLFAAISFSACKNESVTGISPITSGDSTTLDNTVVPILVPAYPPMLLPNDVSNWIVHYEDPFSIVFYFHFFNRICKSVGSPPMFDVFGFCPYFPN